MSTMDLHWKPPRIRLFFEEQGMLSKAQVNEGLVKSWYLVNADLSTIAHLAAHIGREYRLGGSCPQGLVLEMHGFVLPAGQSVRILQDSDLVRVRRKHERELIRKSLSVDNAEIDHAYRIDRGGLLAIEEFEKVAGCYQGELSDGDAEFSLSSGKEIQSARDEQKRLRGQDSSRMMRKRSPHIDSQTQNNVLVLSPKPRMDPEGIDSEPYKSKKQKSSKKKKHGKLARADRGSSQIVALELSMLDGLPRSEHFDRVVSVTAEKKKKKKKRELVEQAGPGVNCTGASAGTEANAQEAKPGKRRKVISAKETANPVKPAEIESVPQNIKPESSRKGEKSKKGQDANHDSHETELLRERSEGEKINGIPLNSGTSPEQANTTEKGPSRSARRKKAKRKWLRRHGQNGIVPKKDDVKTLQPEPKDPTDTSESETSEDETETEAETDAVAEAQTKVEADAEAEAEAEAEEEILPRMYAPGHIRFDHVEDAGNEGRFAAGQAWGQEKPRGRYSDDGHDRKCNGNSEVTMEQSPSKGVVANKIDFEKLPLLSRNPVVGDLLAYQLVELTSSWTPELSSYRVGNVSTYDGASEMITLEPVPEYPIHAQQPEDEDGSLNEDLFLPPYSSDGTLEVSLAALMEVKVVEAGPVQVNCQSQDSPDVNATTVDVPITSPEPPTVNETFVEPVESTVADRLKVTSTADSPRCDHAELRAGGGNEGEIGRSSIMQPEPFLDQSTDAGWQEILSQEISNKKLELSLKASKELGAENCDGSSPADGAKTRSSRGTAVESSKSKPRLPGAPIIRHRYMRAGALGPTMALLRASQNL